MVMATTLPRPPWARCSSATTSAPVSLGGGLECVAIDRLDGVHVEHAGRDPFAGQRLGRVERGGDHQAVGDDGQVGPVAKRIGLADRERGRVAGVDAWALRDGRRAGRPAPCTRASRAVAAWADSSSAGTITTKPGQRSRPARRLRCPSARPRPRRSRCPHGCRRP